MANFTAKKLTANKVNGGVEYQLGDTPQFNATNAIVGGVMYATELAEKSGDVSYINASFANALKGNTQGEIVSIKDVSPIEHIMSVKLESKNLINQSVIGSIFEQNGITIEYLPDEDCFVINGSISTGSTQWRSPWISLPTKNGEYYTGSVKYISGTVSKPTEDRSTVYFRQRDKDLKASNWFNVRLNQSNTSTTKTATDKPEIQFSFLCQGEVSFVDYKFRIQLERGSTSTDWAPCVDVSTVKISKLGKNLLPFPYSGTSGTVANGLTFTVNEDRSITVSGIATGNTYFVIGNKDFGITNMTAKDTYSSNGIYVASERVNYNGGNKNITLYILNGTDYSTPKTFYPQIELGTVATEYEPYKEPIEYIPNADGTVEGVISLYPSTTLLTDKEGVIITAEYNRDLNKAFAELYNAIISLGGNV